MLVASLEAELIPIDTTVNTWSTLAHTSVITAIAVTVSNLLDTIILLPLTIIVAIILYARHHKKYAVLLPTAMGTITLIVEAIKDLVQSPRPANGIVPETGFSFPSGHVTSTMVFFGILTYFVWQQRKSTKAKALSTTLYTAIEALVGFSRVYLNVHWLSDIIGGYLLGAFWLMLLILLSVYLERNLAKLKGQPKQNIESSTETNQHYGFRNL